MNLIKTFFADESGATAMEYALVATLIGMTIIGTVAVLGDGIRGLFNNGSAETMANQTAKIR